MKLMIFNNRGKQIVTYITNLSTLNWALLNTQYTYLEWEIPWWCRRWDHVCCKRWFKYRYFIASSNLFKFITDLEVRNQSESVHFPVFCTLSFSDNEHSVQENEFVNKYMKFKWKDTLKYSFLESFNLIYNALRGSIFDKIASNVGECVQTIVKLYQVAAECMDRVKRIWYLSPMRAAKVQASLRIRAVSAEPPLLAHTSSESRGTFRQKARSLAPLNGWACAVRI